MIYISHGEKGGVGKSRLAMVLIDYLLKVNARPVVLIEGDKSGQDVGERYADIVETGFINLNRPDHMQEAFSSLGNWIEEHGEGKDVVINLPGQAFDTLDKFADLLAATMEMAGQDLVVFYSLGTLDLHLNNLVESMKNGLMSVVPLERQIVVMSEAVGSVDQFAWAHSDARTAYLGAGGKEGFVPKLLPSALDTRMGGLPGPYSAFLGKDSPFSLTDRGLLFRWLKSADAVVFKGVKLN
jgi:hypothetical protein